MKIILFSFSARGAIGDYLFLLTKELSKKVKLILIVPSYFQKDQLNTDIIHFVVPQNKFFYFLKLINPIFWFNLIKEIISHNPDIVHVFFGEGYPPMIPLALYLRLKKIPLILTLHDPEIHPYNLIEKIGGILRLIVMKLSSAIHIHSKFFVDSLKKRGVMENKIFIIPHGSFAPLFKKYKKETIFKENKILFFGRLEKYKGIEYFINAGLKLKGSFKFVIAGPGKLQRSLLNIIEKNQNVFEFHNKYLKEEEVAYLFQKAKICVLPYIQATQSSIPLLAAFFGVSVVATKTGGFIEDVPRINGILVEPKNTESLVKGIFEALNKKPIYPLDLEFENLVEKFIEMYEKVY